MARRAVTGKLSSASSAAGTASGGRQRVDRGGQRVDRAGTWASEQAAGSERVTGSERGAAAGAGAGAGGARRRCGQRGLRLHLPRGRSGARPNRSQAARAPLTGGAQVARQPGLAPDAIPAASSCSRRRGGALGTLARAAWLGALEEAEGPRVTVMPIPAAATATAATAAALEPEASPGLGRQARPGHLCQVRPAPRFQALPGPRRQARPGLRRRLPGLRSPGEFTLELEAPLAHGPLEPTANAVSVALRIGGGPCHGPCRQPPGESVALTL